MDRVGSAADSRAIVVAEAATEPLSAIGNPVLELPGQIARFGDLIGRELSARALAAWRASEARDPQRHVGVQDCEPLSEGEQLEMLALRAAITGDNRMAAPAGTADETQPGSPQILHRPARLWRPAPPPGSQRAPARHRRVADTNQR